MLDQILYYNVTIFQIDSFSLNINALLLLSIFLISLKFKKKTIAIISYLLIIISITNLFIFSFNAQTNIDLTFLSKINFFIYNIFNYPINSVNTYFMIYSYLNILVFIPFYPIFNKHRIFYQFVLVLIVLQMVFVALNIAATNFSLFYLLLNIIGYLVGYLIVKFKGDVRYEHKE